MGLSGYSVDAIGRENAYRPIKGDVFFIGRQSVSITASELASRLRAHGNTVDESAIEVDRTTTYRSLHASHQVSDRSIFLALGGCRVKALDVSPYEGAEIIAVVDLNGRRCIVVGQGEHLRELGAGRRDRTRRR